MAKSLSNENPEKSGTEVRVDIDRNFSAGLYLGGKSRQTPRLLATFSIWLIDLYGASNTEEIADLEFLYRLTVSFVLVLIFTAFALVLRRLIRKHYARPN